MQQMLQDFFKAVRSHDITISAAESIEASRTAELIGFDDREILKLALSVTLAKSVDEKARFNDCFDEFFTFNSFQQGEESASSASPAKAPANESQPLANPPKSRLPATTRASPNW